MATCFQNEPRKTDLGAIKGTLVVIAMEPIWPPNHGGRVDRWNRCKLLKQEGWRLLFVGWSGDDGHLAEDHRAAMAQVFAESIFFSNRRGISSVAKRLFWLIRHSPHMSSRFVAQRESDALCRQLAAYKPDAIVMDGLYGADLSICIAQQLKLPLVYRSHNIEHLYMPRQARAAKSFGRKWAMRLASLHLKRAERDLIMKADWVFDISADDMTFWKVRASAHRISWLPPLLDAAPSGRPPPLPWHDRPYDAVYLGNLNTPNNVEGLTWFVKTVLPELRIRRSEISILIAGSNPSQEVLDLVESDSSLQVRVNPADVGEVRALGRVMINPVLQGSGVNVKSVEMLATDSPVVTTPVGVQGLDAETIGAFHIADTPQEFAAMVDQLIDLGPVNDNDRNDIRSRFGKGGAQALSQKLTEIIAQNRS